MFQIWPVLCHAKEHTQSLFLEEHVQSLWELPAEYAKQIY